MDYIFAMIVVLAVAGGLIGIGISVGQRSMKASLSRLPPPPRPWPREEIQGWVRPLEPWPMPAQSDEVVRRAQAALSPSSLKSEDGSPAIVDPIMFMEGFVNTCAGFVPVYSGQDWRQVRERVDAEWRQLMAEKNNRKES